MEPMLSYTDQRIHEETFFTTVVEETAGLVAYLFTLCFPHPLVMRNDDSLCVGALRNLINTADTLDTVAGREVTERTREYR